MGKSFRLSLLAILLAWNVPRSTAGDADLPRYRSSASEVQLTLTALDRNGHAVANLKEDDFAVVDRDVVVRKWRSLHRSAFTRVEIAVVADSSASVHPNFRREVSSLATFSNDMEGLPEENFSIISFRAQRPAVLCAGNCRAAHSGVQFPSSADGLTPLFDTVVFASDFLAQRASPDAKKVLVVLSDGEDTISRMSSNDVLNSLQSNEVEVYTVDTGSSDASGGALLNKLATATGGRYFRLEQSQSLVDAVLEDFRATYVVTYDLPSRKRGYHSVHVLPVHDMSLRFRSTDGYYYPGR